MAVVAVPRRELGAIKSGRLRSVKLGAARYITAEALRAFVRELAAPAGVSLLHLGCAKVKPLVFGGSTSIWTPEHWPSAGSFSASPGSTAAPIPVSAPSAIIATTAHPAVHAMAGLARSEPAAGST